MSLLNRDARTWESRICIAVLLAFPLILLSISTNWIYSLTGFLDPWYYVGYSRNYSLYVSKLFPNTYYGTRLGFILPGVVCYSLFKPIVANCILHLFFYYVAAFSLFSILNHFYGHRPALLASLCMGSYSYFQMSVGMDNPDGAGMAYLVLSMALTAKAASAEKRSLWLFLAGMGSATMLHSHLFLISYLIVCPGLYCSLCWVDGRDKLIRCLVQFSIWAGIGFVVLTALFGAINAACGGAFFFFMPSFTYATSFVSKPNPWKAETYAWVKSAAWLIIDYFALAIAIINILVGLVDRHDSRSKHDNVRLIFCVQFVLLALLMIAWELKGTPVLQYCYYASYLIPAAFLVVGAEFAKVFENERTTLLRWALMSGVLGLILLAQHSEWFLVRSASVLSGSLAVVVLTALCLFVVSLFVRKIEAISFLALAAGLLPLLSTNRSPSTRDNSLDFSRMMETCENLEAHLSKKRPRFWYDEKERMGYEFKSLASIYIWGHSLVNEEFPAISSVLHGQALPRVENAVLVVLSDRKNAAETALKSLREMHLSGDLLYAKSYDKKYDVNIFSVVYGASIPIRFDKTLARFCFGDQRDKERINGSELITGWQACPEAPTAGFVQSDGTTLLSMSEAEGICAFRLGPFYAEEDAIVNIVLTYRETEGRIIFGAVEQNGSSWLEKCDNEIKGQSDKHQRISLNVRKGIPIWLGIANARKREKGVTQIAIKSVECFLIQKCESIPTAK